MTQLSSENYARPYQFDHFDSVLRESGSSPPLVKAADGTLLPTISLGLADNSEIPLCDLALDAFLAGYRAVHCPADLNKIMELNLALEKARDKFNLSRDKLFLSLQLHPRIMSYAEIILTFDRYLNNLGQKYVDLCLLTWPGSDQCRFVDGWRALIRLKSEGKIKHLGLASFPPAPIDRLTVETGVRPLINQVELHPYFQQAGLCAAMERRGIKIGVWTPLSHSLALNNPLIQSLGLKYGKSPAQIILKWHLSSSRLVAAAATKPDHIRNNLDVMNFKLSPSDLFKISLLDTGLRLGPPPVIPAVARQCAAAPYK